MYQCYILIIRNEFYTCKEGIRCRNVHFSLRECIGCQRGGVVGDDAGRERRQAVFHVQRFHVAIVVLLLLKNKKSTIRNHKITAFEKLQQHYNILVEVDSRTL